MPLFFFPVSRTLLRGTSSSQGVGTGHGGCGGDSALQPYRAGSTREEGHTYTHTHTQGRTRECCTCPLPIYPLVSARLSQCRKRGLVAPYCAIPQDYLSDAPLLRAMGFLVSQHGRLGAIPPPLFFERFRDPPWRACEVEVRYPPPLKRGISPIPARYHMKTRQMGAIPPSAILPGYLTLGR